MSRPEPVCASAESAHPSKEMDGADGNPRLSFRGGEILQRRAPETKPETRVIMTATPRRVAGGESVTLTWGVTQGAAEFHDWLGLFSETDEKKCLRHSYAKGCHRGGTWVVEAPPDGGRCVLPSFPSLSQPPALPPSLPPTFGPSIHTCLGLCIGGQSIPGGPTDSSKNIDICFGSSSRSSPTT